MILKQTFQMLLPLFLAGTLIADAGAEKRTHYVVATRDRIPVYHATTVTRSSQKASEETYLIEDAGGARFFIEVGRNFETGEVSAEYRAADGRPVRVRFVLPGTAHTLKERLAEHKARPALAKEDVTVTIESVDQTFKVLESQWRSGNLENRQKAKAIVGSTFVSRVTPLKSLLAFPQFGGACSTFPFVSDGQNCVGITSLMIAIDRPDCDFDASFGKPCDDAQKLRARNQPVNSRVGSY